MRLWTGSAEPTPYAMMVELGDTLVTSATMFALHSSSNMTQSVLYLIKRYDLHIALANLAVIVFDGMIDITFLEIWVFWVFIVDCYFSRVGRCRQKMKNEMKYCHRQKHCRKPNWTFSGLDKRLQKGLSGQSVKIQCRSGHAKATLVSHVKNL